MLIITIPLTTVVLGISIYNFPIQYLVDVKLIFLGLAMIFFCNVSQIKLPRTNIYLTVSDVFIFAALLIYGGEVATILAVIESLLTCLNSRRKGLTMKIPTIILNVGIAGITTFFTALTATYVFGQITQIPKNAALPELLLLLTFLAGVQFLLNSIFVTIITAHKTDKNVWLIWYEYCLNGLVLFLVGALVGGIIVKGLYNIDPILILVALAVAVTGYFTYRRYADDVRDTVELAENAERERAEQAENHIEELQHHILQQKQIEKELRQSREKFKFAAYHDPLTSLPNRNQFVQQVRYCLEETKEDANFGFTVLSLDLNRFKTINESLGHKTGDKLIVSVARRLLNSVRADDFVARFSGDEFGIILTGISKEEDVISCIKIITEHFKESFEIDERSVFTSVAVGVAVGNDKYVSAEDIVRDAEIAMYRAKSREQKYEIFNPLMHADAVSLLQTETDLRYAIERNELEAFYQPIVCLKTMNVIGFESLMRWNHPTRGLVSPAEFIPVSENTGLIVPMTLWMLKESCKKLSKWSQMSPANKNLMMSVNLSGKHFAEDDLVAQVKNILTEENIEPKRLKLEITESAIMDNAESAISILNQLKRVGVQLSIDDFGTGYSSLSYLHRFPINTLKIDRSFVSAMENGSENGEIVSTVIALAKALNLTIIAEGIETIHQLHQLRILGCEYGQGFLFSRPIQVDQVETLLDDKERWKNIISNHQPIPAMRRRQTDTVVQLNKDKVVHLGELEN
jgi:diguanylate cyclase (GGDEF)-like protein